MPSITQISNTPANAKDSWRTPRWLFDWLDRRFGFVVDLAASEDNHLCAAYFDAATDALAQEWHELTVPVGFCNPPYSNITPWLIKAQVEAMRGFTTAALIPAPNGEDRYGQYVFGVASEVIWITGRIAFINGAGRPVSGNTRGSIVAIYEAHNLGDTRYRHVWRNAIQQRFDAELAGQTAE